MQHKIAVPKSEYNLRMNDKNLKSFIFLKLLIVLVLAFFLTGCWGYREVDEQAFVLVLGIDKGVKDVIGVTALIAVPKGITGGGGMGGVVGGNGSPSTMIVRVEAKTILSALDLFNSFVERRISLKHTRLVIFSSELARQDISQYIAPLTRFRQFRRNIFIGVSTGLAKEVVEKIKPVMESNPAKYIELLLASQSYSSTIPVSLIHHFNIAAKSLGEQPVAFLIGTHRHIAGKGMGRPSSEGAFIAGHIPREGGTDVEIMGTAVFRGGKMVGELNGDETTILNMLKGNYREALFALDDPLKPGMYIPLEISARQKPSIKVSLDSEGLPVLDVTVFLEGDFISIQSGLPYEKPSLTPLVEKSLEKVLARMAARFLEKAQNQFQADVAGFGNKARYLVATWQDWEKLNWPELYPEAKISIHFDLKMRRIGLLRKSVPVQE